MIWKIIICFMLFIGISQIFCHKLIRNLRKMDEGGTGNDGKFLFTVIIKDSKGSTRCNGALISEQHIVTTAFCAQSFDDVSEIQVILGTPPVKMGVLDVIIHDSYDTEEGDNNIALFQLADMVASWGAVMPACLARTDDVFKNPLFLATGITDASWNRKLNVARLVTVPTKNCEELLDATITDGMICARGFENTCPVEDGSPLVQIDEDNVPTLIGLTSYASCEPKEPIIFTRIAYFSDWIYENTLGSLIC